MKQNISDIMNDLHLGQIIRFQGKEYCFVEPKRTRAVIRDRHSGKEYLIKGMVEVTDEIDTEAVNQIEEEAVNAFITERKIAKMKKGTRFIGKDDKEYIFIKFNQKTFDCESVDTGEAFRAKPGFIKAILTEGEKNYG